MAATAMASALSSATRSLLLVVAVVLVADALLGALTVMVAGIGGAATGPWWIEGHLLDRSRWVVFVALLMVTISTRAIRELADGLPDATAAWRLVGALALVTPLLWIVALWLVQTVLFTAAGRWDIDGRMFLSPGYYQRLFAGYAPWALGGAAALVMSRHAE